MTKRKAAGTDGLPSKRRRAKTAAKAAPQKRQNKEPQYPKASLLGIPGELRNSIYRYALLESTEIKIDQSNHNYPNLIKVSSQIYRESRDIYLKENQFVADVIDFKPVLPIYGIHWAFSANLLTRFPRPQSSWANLKEWVRLWYTSQAVGLEVRVIQPHFPADVKMAIRAFNIARRMRDLYHSWDEVEPVLEEFKMATEEAGFGWR